jgi:hypothetical protein
MRDFYVQDSLRRSMRPLLFALAVAMTWPASASPPPPSPEHIWSAGEALRAPERQSATRIAALFADDVRATPNGKAIAQRRAAWLKWREHDTGCATKRVIGYSASSSRPGSEGELLIVEAYDTVDRSDRSATISPDPWMATRSTLYVFGPDRRIRSVIMSETAGRWIAARP